MAHVTYKSNDSALGALSAVTTASTTASAEFSQSRQSHQGVVVTGYRRDCRGCG